jgi:hypothetical protein
MLHCSREDCTTKVTAYGRLNGGGKMKYGTFFILSAVLHYFTLKIKTKFCGLSKRTNYTDRATAACR